MDNKILIISHNIIDESNNIGKTLISLLKNWHRDQIFSIYLRNETRVTMFCKEAFEITDKDILASLFTTRNDSCGRIINSDNNLRNYLGNQGAYRLGNKRYELVSLIRDIIWSFNTWKTSQLDNWIRKVNPDLILFVPNDYVLAYNIANHVLNLLNVPIVTFFTDDSFFFGQYLKPIEKVRKTWIRKKGKEIIKKSSLMFTASPAMAEEYERLFDTNSQVIGNCVEITSEEFTKITEESGFQFTYIGNLHSKRWKCLAEIGKALDMIKVKKGINAIVNIYSASDLSNNVKKIFNGIRSIILKGSVPPMLVKNIQEEADALLHIEAFDSKSRKSTRLSMSTKIYEYMARNVPIFAYGPPEVASIRFLSEGNFAFICTNRDNLYQMLDEFISENKGERIYSRNAYDYAKKNFSQNEVALKFQKMLIEVIEKPMVIKT